MTQKTIKSGTNIRIKIVRLFSIKTGFLKKLNNNIKKLNKQTK